MSSSLRCEQVKQQPIFIFRQRNLEEFLQATAYLGCGMCFGNICREFMSAHSCVFSRPEHRKLLIVMMFGKLLWIEIFKLLL